MSLKDLQNMSLCILKDVHEFCTKNKINYSLAYGTLIGAVRHKGFIPWDDDIDIIMPRPDFERFFKEYKSNNGYISVSPNDCLLSFGRVVDVKKTRAISALPWTTKEYGCWIDIFPIDGVEDDESKFQQVLTKMSKYKKILTFCRGSYRSLQDNNLTIWLKTKILLKRLLFANIILKIVKNNQERMIKRVPFGSSCKCGSLSMFEYTHKERYPYECFKFYIDVDFESLTFKAIGGYDVFLRNFYGNYMQLPPIEQQVPKQSYIKFYWK